MVLPEGASIRIVIVDDSGLRATVLEEMLVVSRALARPIAMFVDQSDGAMIGAAIDAGVSAYVVDGLRKERVKPVLELAVRRWLLIPREAAPSFRNDAAPLFRELLAP